MKTFNEFMNESKKELVYTVHGDSDIKINNKVLKSHKDLEKHFPKEKYGNHVFNMIDSKTGKRFDGPDDNYSYHEIHKDLKNFGSES